MFSYHQVASANFALTVENEKKKREKENAEQDLMRWSKKKCVRVLGRVGAE
jgi:hypothetical protein